MSSDENNQKTDATGFMASVRSATGANKRYLGDLTVVDGLVRALAGEVYGRAVQVFNGEITQPEAAKRDQEACHQLARILNGESEDYQPVPGWNGHGLAQSVRRQHKESVSNEDDVSVLAQAVAMLVLSLYQAARDVKDDDAQALQQETDELVRSFTWFLLGIESNE